MHDTLTFCGQASLRSKQCTSISTGPDPDVVLGHRIESSPCLWFPSRGTMPLCSRTANKACQIFLDNFGWSLSIQH
jgi:hypothetical protein